MFDHSAKIVVVIVVLGGLVVWAVMPGGDPVKALQEKCKEQGLPVRMIKLEPGSAKRTSSC